MKKIIYKNIDEVVYQVTLKNNMNVILLYKPNFIEKTAYIVSKFGHFDSIRKINLNGKEVQIPWGAAHFLEHRMFNINNQDASDLFSKFGAYCNAYTTYEKTTYFFSCQSHFYECLKILLEMVDSFSSTDEQINKEKSIIIQEAKMYQEEPIHLLTANIFDQAYFNHPINHEVIGTVETINQINKEELSEIFNIFYNPANLTLVVAGDILPSQLEEFLNKNLLKEKSNVIIEPLKISEPEKVKKEMSTIYLPTINTTRFAFLFKLKAIQDAKEKDKMYFCYNFILDYLFSDSGKLSEKWLSEKIISTLLEYSIYSNIDLDCIIFYNIGEEIDLVVENIKKVFNKNQEFTMSLKEFEDMKKCYYGRTIKSYETVGGLCSNFVYDLYTSCNDFFLETQEVRSLTLNDIYKAYQNICEAVTTLVVLRGD